MLSAIVVAFVQRQPSSPRDVLCDENGCPRLSPVPFSASASRSSHFSKKSHDWYPMDCCHGIDQRSAYVHREPDSESTYKQAVNDNTPPTFSQSHLTNTSSAQPHALMTAHLPEFVS
jgi:hypothetical protein